MKDEKKIDKKPLDLFLKKVKPEDLPERGATLPRRDIVAHKKLEAEIEKLEYEREKTEVPIYKAWIESLGLSFDEMREITEEKKRIRKQFQESFKKAYTDYMFYETAVVDPVVEALLLNRCKEVTIRVCKQKVCVDQPVPLSVDRVWEDPGSDGTLDMVSDYDRFEYHDAAYGYSTWNLFYHRHSRTHEGGINIRSSAELVEPAKVRQIGMVFEPLLDGKGWPLPNGVFASGDDAWLLPTSWGRGKMWISFQVSRKTPGGTNWISLLPDNRINYKDTGKITSRIMQSHAYPPPRVMTLNEDYPAGTQFLIETNLSYWIKGLGDEGNAWADYALEARPIMNLEACSWKYPKWVTVQVPD